MKLSSIDLNLLVAFDALMTECHVTRAAERVGLSQPGMSNALARLRDLLDDPVLVRTSTGMKPTPRALELVAPVQRALTEIESALGSTEFEPSETSQAFRIAATDYVEFTLLMEVAGRVGREAPGASLRVIPMEPEYPVTVLEEGHADLVVGFQPGDVSERCHEQRLFTETFVCIVRQDHPQVGDSLSLEEFASLPHVLVSVRGDPRGFVDDMLEEEDLDRHVAIVTPHFLCAPRAVTRGDYVCTMTETVARHLAERLPLKVVSAPVPMPRFDVSLFWHDRTHYDPAHQWMRRLITNVAQEMSNHDERR